MNRIEENKLKRNGEGYPDPTAYEAIRRVKLDPETERFHKLLNAIFTICEISDFYVVDRIVVKDKRTGKVWR